MSQLDPSLWQSPTQTNISITPSTTQDLPSTYEIWSAALPNYPITQETLAILLPQGNGHHWIAKVKDQDGGEDKPVGFCLSYTAKHLDKKPADATKAYIAVLAVLPAYQARGIGTALLRAASTKMQAEPGRVEIGSSFPRFWPGVPVEGPSVASSSSAGDQSANGDGQKDRSHSALDFFANRGFRMSPDPPRSVDLYRNIRSFSLRGKGSDTDYAARAHEAGYTFSPLGPDGYEECLAGQRRSFADNPDWVDMYAQLDPSSHPSSIMTAFDPHGKQVGWTLMLGPSSTVLQSNWAMPSICGPNTGLIGCVGIDEEHRKSGVGIALVAHALNDMKDRGVEGVFVDWVALEGFYERVGFEVWARYRTGEILAPH
ncbi:putative beta-N-acetylglucosaminidase [Aspergillus mulundensis]|uniref:N-acetyltransferase domain-containing protein n=1 Tax=Aspergillus mulundensis TaxID=1810919 RepID=A0A3D8SJP5_9EURO|nr:hypothetical protein DSM5745_03182 [Aspergillus mulundensis]RDW86540.1 hypothetical protein DSM5745_03182 [Aspergillus mulundensis]